MFRLIVNDLPRFLRVILYLGISVFLSSCASETFVIERSKASRTQARQIKKLVVIEPDFYFMDERKKVENRYLVSAEKEKQLNKWIQKNGKRVGIEIQLVDDNNLTEKSVEFFNEMIILKNEINQVLLLQSPKKLNPYHQKIGGLTRPKQFVFDKMPLISSRFSHLAEKYQTPYFSFLGITSYVYPNVGSWFWLIVFPPYGIYTFLKPDVSTYYYFVVANVETSEILYREVRTLPNFAYRATIPPLIYDSFRILTKP